MKRDKALANIKANIENFGFYMYSITPSTLPAYSYTIGLAKDGLPELIVAGSCAIMGPHARAVLRAAREKLLAGEQCPTVEIDGATYTSRMAHETWIAELMLGATDYFDRMVPALQLTPAAPCFDVPDMTEPPCQRPKDAWKWLREPWPYAVSPKSLVAVCLDVIAGAEIVEVSRWEDDYWEVFSDSGICHEDAMRMLSLPPLIGGDPSLAAALNLKLGTAIWRSDGQQPWEHSTGNSE